MARYRIDPALSRVVIDASSTLHSIHTETDGLQGWLALGIDAHGRLDLAVEQHAHLELAVSRLRSGNVLEDRELLRRIEAQRFPTVSGDLTSIESTDREGRYWVKGDVTFRGVRRASEGLMTLAVQGDDQIRWRGSSSFDIRDFGLEPPRLLMLKVSPHVRVSVDVVATRES